MISWFHEQRLDAVQTALARCGARTVLDLGCGEGHLLTRLAGEPRIERVVGIDLSLPALTRLRSRLQDMPAAARARIELLHGPLAEVGLPFIGFDAAVLVETLEHIASDRLSDLERAVFLRMRPATVVITTPNAEFNALLGVPSHRFRHPDHRFEWSRAKFQLWISGVARRSGYLVSRHDIAGCHPVCGGASQMAVFVRAALAA